MKCCRAKAEGFASPLVWWCAQPAGHAGECPIPPDVEERLQRAAVKRDDPAAELWRRTARVAAEDAGTHQPGEEWAAVCRALRLAHDGAATAADRAGAIDGGAALSDRLASLAGALLDELEDAQRAGLARRLGGGR